MVNLNTSTVGQARTLDQTQNVQQQPASSSTSRTLAPPATPSPPYLPKISLSLPIGLVNCFLNHNLRSSTNFQNPRVIYCSKRLFSNNSKNR